MTYVFLVVSNPNQASDAVYVNSRRGRLNLVHGGFILRICSSGDKFARAYCHGRALCLWQWT